MTPDINIGTLLCRGRYKAVVHSGHRYDAAGTIIEHGHVKQETPFSGNLITKLGFDLSLGRELSGQQFMICGPSSTPVTEDDVAMGDAFGAATQSAGSVLKASNSDPANGPLFRTVEHRRTFPPGSLGPNPVVIAKAGIACGSNGNIEGVRQANLLSAGLLRDNLGNPTTVSALPTDFVDIVWEYTETLAFDAAMQMPFDEDGAAAPRACVVRPIALWNVQNGTLTTWPSLGTTVNDFSPAFVARSTVNASPNATTGVDASALVPASTILAGGYGIDTVPSSATSLPYVNGSKKRRYVLSWAPSAGNIDPAISRALITFGPRAPGDNRSTQGAFQVSFDPPIPKVASKQLELAFELAMANAP